MSKDLINFIQDLYDTKNFIPLHEPFFDEKDKEAMVSVIESSFVSSVGPLVSEFERLVCDYTGSKFAIATSNGTAALHTSLLLSGVNQGDEVITQSLTFVATCNAISYCSAHPIFLDVSLSNLGLSSESLSNFLEQNCEIREDGYCWNKSSNRIIKACVPMHTFGLSVDIEDIKDICMKYNIALIEDAAESLGSLHNKKHSGTLGDFGVLSFNGNKIITTGGGGMILTNDPEKAALAKHLTTTAKLSDKLFFNHDRVGFNYRMPNLNAALGISQIKKIDKFIIIKRKIANRYQEWADLNSIHILKEAKDDRSNYWLNTIIAEDVGHRDGILKDTNTSKVMTRPAWNPMHTLSFNKKFQTDSLENTKWLFERLVNLPSSIKGSPYESL